MSNDPELEQDPIFAQGQNTFSIGEVASLLGVHTHTIRFWEKSFRITISRKESNRRSYTLADISLLKKIQRLVHRDRMSLNTARCQLEAEGLLTPEPETEPEPTKSNLERGKASAKKSPEAKTTTEEDDAKAKAVLSRISGELRAVVDLLKTASRRD